MATGGLPQIQLTYQRIASQVLIIEIICTLEGGEKIESILYFIVHFLTRTGEGGQSEGVNVLHNKP